MRRSVMGGAFLVLVAASAGGAEAITPDGVMVAGERLRSTLLNSEEKVVRVAALAGTKLTLQATRLKRSTVRPSLAVWGPDGEPVDLGKRVHSTRRSAKLRKFDVQQTGVWRVAVRAEAGGGAFQLTSRSNVRRRLVVPAQLADDVDVGEHELDALPGSTLVLRAIPRGRPRWTPVASVRAPSGALVPPVAAKSARGTRYLLPELGTYVIEVAGGPGKYKMIASVRPLGPRSRTLEYSDIEALPEGDSVSPNTVPNDSVHRLTISGRGFTTVSQVTLFDGTGDILAGTAQSQTATSIGADFDMTGVAPGAYTFRFITESARSIDAPLPLTVTNHPPGVVSIDSPELPWADAHAITVHGVGFDDGATVTVRRSVDALDAPVAVGGRTGHQEIDLVLTLPEFAVGKYDITVRDPSGVESTLEEGLDVLGFRHEEVDAIVYAGGHISTHFPRDAAYDTQNGTVLVAFEEENQVLFRLFNATTLVELDSLVAPGVTSNNVRQRTPRVAWSPVDEAWALCWVHDAQFVDEAHVRIVGGSDLDVLRGEEKLGGEETVSRVDVKSDLANGGWAVVWDEVGSSASKLRGRRLTGAGALSGTFAATVADDEFGLISDPALEYMTSGRWIVAYAHHLDATYSIRRVVIRAENGELTGGVNDVMAESTEWIDAFRPEVARHPTDESVLLGFSYIEEDPVAQRSVSRSAYIRLSPRSADAGELMRSDTDGVLVRGLVDSIVWDPERAGFVVALTDTRPSGSADVVVRRVFPDSRPQQAWQLQAYEGTWGILYAGAAPGTLGIVRSTDGTPDGRFTNTGEAVVVGGLMR